MSYQEQVQRAKDPQEALAVIGRALDVIMVAIKQRPEPEPDPWGTWEQPAPEEDRIEIEAGDDAAIVKVPVVTEEKKEQRRAFAKDVLDLESAYPNYPEPGIIEAYATAGPMLLYLSDRDFVISLPPDVKQKMVIDVSEHSSEDALEMGRDVFKDSQPGGDHTRSAEAIDAIRATL